MVRFKIPFNPHHSLKTKKHVLLAHALKIVMKPQSVGNGQLANDVQLTHVLTVQNEHMILLAAGLLYPGIFNVEILTAIVLLFSAIKLH